MKKIFLLVVFLLLIECCSGCARYTSNLVEQKDDEENVTVAIVNISFPKQDNQYSIIDSKICNNTKNNIIAYKRGMLAFDEKGNPLELYWTGMDSSAEKSFYNSYSTTNIKIEAGQETEPIGWTLFSMKAGAEENYDRIKYIIYSFEEITFDNGTVWKNKDITSWLEKFKGKKIDIQNLSTYYPYEQYIEYE